ncbi:phosphosulfolactate synthase [Paenibacillus campinasensis]|uniref:Phosphosulfolactate synthase n=1 Tax=Paenibacillus campinasensis TaxID=66347 RepID=A0A268ETT8_9BACL|nr:phosphosulfolactate synthase [Paenibacillus campinasensis]PAD76553.1 phosphosulfolactate synthase [Paenibacillus campinasensis]
MRNTGLHLPERQSKPRQSGLTVLIDNGVPLQFFRDTLESAAAYIDFIKFGWGTSLVTPQLEQKIAILRDHQVEFFFGGTLFEKYLSQRKLEDYRDFCLRCKATYIEISNGTLPISNREKANYIKQFSDDFLIMSEVGHKDDEVSETLTSSEWIESILEDLDAGAYKVITEARESGTSGICHSTGEMRLDIINDIVESGISLDRIIFEAPNKRMQTCFIQLVGSDVNLANIPFSDPISLETLRLGLRSDTFYTFA